MINQKQIPFNPSIKLLSALFFIFQRDTDTGYMPYNQVKDNLQDYQKISPKKAAKCIKYAVSRGWMRVHHEFLYGSFKIDDDIKVIPLDARQLSHIQEIEKAKRLLAEKLKQIQSI